jgi:hypothetical protein
VAWENASNTWMVDYSACCYATSGKDPVWLRAGTQPSLRAYDLTRRKAWQRGSLTSLGPFLYWPVLQCNASLGLEFGAINGASFFWCFPKLHWIPQTGLSNSAHSD